MTLTTARAEGQDSLGSQKLVNGGDQTSSSLTTLRLVADIFAHLEGAPRRVVQDALQEATASYWQRRAVELENARPRSADYHGRATREALRARWDRLTAQPAACRTAARVALIQDLDDDVRLP